VRGGHGTRRTTAEAGPVMGSELRPRRRDRCHCRGLQTRPPRPRPTCGALPAGAVRAASLNVGGMRARPPAPSHRRRPCRARACNPTDTAFTRRRAIARDLHEKTPAAQDASSASGRQQQHPRWQRRSAPAAAAAGAAETAAAAAVNAAPAASSS